MTPRFLIALLAAASLTLGARQLSQPPRPQSGICTVMPWWPSCWIDPGMGGTTPPKNGPTCPWPPRVPPPTPWDSKATR